MKLGFGNSNFGVLANKSVKGLDGFYRYNRFIVLSEVTSDTIPNILDIIFEVSSGGAIDSILGNNQKTKVTVINNSEVYGSYIYGISDTRTRSVYIHHGIADCNINCVRGDTLIKFTDVDYNVIADKPSVVSKGGVDALGEVQLSYDSAYTGGVITRDVKRYDTIMVPSPEFYDETDMVLLSGREEDYSNTLESNRERIYVDDSWVLSDRLYKLTLNDLIDEHTKVMKLNIKIDNLSSRKGFSPYHNSSGTNPFVETSEFTELTEFNNLIHDTVCNCKYAMEKNGFSNAEIIFNGMNGYNITNLKSYLNLNKIERHLNFEMLCGEIDKLNEFLFDDYNKDLSNQLSIMVRVDYSNVKVIIVDFYPELSPINTINKTDTDVKELGDALKQCVPEGDMFPMVSPYI